jgi:hypothetical protein
MSSFFSSKAKELIFSKEQKQLFQMENVVLHRHFQEKLEDAQYVLSIFYHIFIFIFISLLLTEFVFLCMCQEKWNQK